MFVKPQRVVSKVFLHCSASDNPKHDNIKTIRLWHAARGWNNIGYHFYINKLGRICAGRDIEKIPAAQKGHNIATLAICCGGEKYFPAVQMQALRNFCTEINFAYGGRISFHGHCEVEPNKLCPVYDYRKVLGLDADGRII
jgi:hypothetical protein